MATCERCEREGGKPHSLVIRVQSTDGYTQTPAGFHLCDKCYDFGCGLEPIEGIGEFLTAPTQAQATHNERTI